MDRDVALISLKDQLNLAQQCMKRHADTKRREVEFQVSDWVYLKIRPYRQRSLSRKRCEKLAPKFFGPFQILQKIGTVAYRLQLPPTALIHDVFHVSQLKKSIGTHTVVHTDPLLLTQDLEWKVTPEAILGIRTTPDTQEEDWLIQWKGCPGCEATWEAAALIQQQFPDGCSP